MLLTLILACSGDHPGVVSKGVDHVGTGVGRGEAPAAPLGGGGNLPLCESYHYMEDTYGYCLYKMSGAFQSLEEVELWCGQAGQWEGQCRHAFVAGRMHNAQWALEDLLKACGKGNPDCAFEVLDFRPSDDVLVQVKRCEEWTERHQADCVGHAAQRWWLASPAADDLSRVGLGAAAYPDKFGYYMAARVACDKVGACDGEASVKQFCENTVATFTREPTKCPVKGRSPLHSSMGGGPGQATGQPAQPGVPGQPAQPGQPGQGRPSGQILPPGQRPGGQPGPNPPPTPR
jgi:hypothetical protein